MKKFIRPSFLTDNRSNIACDYDQVITEFEKLEKENNALKTEIEILKNILNKDHYENMEKSAKLIKNGLPELEEGPNLKMSIDYFKSKGCK